MRKGNPNYEPLQTGASTLKVSISPNLSEILIVAPHHCSQLL